MLQKPHQDLKQVIHRIFEGRSIIKSTISPFKIYCIGKPYRADIFSEFYKKVHVKDFILSTKKADNCAFFNDETIILINTIILRKQNSKIYVSDQVGETKSFIFYPTDSSAISLFEVTFTIYVTIPVQCISCKAILHPFKNTFICCPIIHTM